MPEQIQSMLILAGSSTSWNVLFHLEQLVEKRQGKKKKEREKKEKDMKSLNVSLPSSGVSNPWRFSEWDSAQSMRKYTKYQNKSQEKKKKERKLEERFYCTITVALVWVYLNFSELSRAAVLAPAAQFRHSAAALQSKVCSRRCDLLQKVRN